MLFSIFFQFTMCCVLFPTQVVGFYFYSNGGDRKCFHKELSKDTLLQGRYNVQFYDDELKSYREANSEEFDVVIDVEETFDDNHRVVHQKGAPTGDFMFIALDSGEYRVCIQPQATKWLNKGKTKVDIEFEIGDDSKVDSKQKSAVESLHSKISILNEKLTEIRREQKLVREREAQFRNISESVNSHAMWWSIVQLIALGVICAWQMRHLRTFFVKQKVL